MIEIITALAPEPLTQGITIAAELWTFLGVAATVVGTYFGTRFIEKKKAIVAMEAERTKRSLALEVERTKREADRDEGTYKEIERLRGVINRQFEDLQEQIIGVRVELKIEREYTDELREHIFAGSPPPPPKRPRIVGVHTGPIPNAELSSPGKVAAEGLKKLEEGLGPKA